MSLTQLSAPSAPAAHRRRRFVRHYLEMLAAMLVGMIVVGGAVRAIVAVAGVSYSTATHPTLSVFEMAFDMSIGMVVWMRHRGHGWPTSLEMTGAMFAPALALAPLLWVGVVDGESMMVLEHVLMLPLMYIAMRRRRDEYEGHAHG